MSSAIIRQDDSRLIDGLNSAIMEATLLFVAGIAKLYESRCRWLREIRKLQVSSDEEMGEEVSLLDDVRRQYQANIRMSSACISDLKAAAKSFFENIPQESSVQRGRASSFFIAYCRAIDGRNSRKKFRRTLEKRSL